MSSGIPHAYRAHDGPRARHRAHRRGAVRPADALTSLRRGAGEVKPLWQRIVGSGLLVALFGWLLEVVGLDGPLVVGSVSGGLLGLFGLTANFTATLEPCNTGEHDLR
jgi:hypothetical protein